MSEVTRYANAKVKHLKTLEGPTTSYGPRREGRKSGTLQAVSKEPKNSQMQTAANGVHKDELRIRSNKIGCPE